MAYIPKQRNIAYRCPGCGSAVIGLVGKFALHANMLRLKCSCGDEQSLDITMADGKIRLSVPCLFCRQNHSYVVSESLFFENDRFLLNCPYSNMDIAIIGDEETVNQELARTEAELNMLMKNLEAEELSDIQPEDMPEAEILPDPAVYDTLRFVVKDLEAEGKLHCPCGKGPYDLRFTDGGMQVWCDSCGATYDFNATSPTMAEEYLELDEIKLK
jgi:hypothetical protein